MMIKEMPVSEKPREKALHYGIETLSNVELLALIIRCGTKEESAIALAGRILVECGGFHRLPELNLNDLKQIKGIKNAKALEILGSIELAKRFGNYEEPIQATIKTSEDVFHLLKSKLIFEKQEKFYVLFLDTKHRVIKEKVMFVGTLDSSIVHPREIFKEAVACSSAAMICAHNHPSGVSSPSPEDIELTKNLSELSEMMNIPLLDHVIIGKSGFFSMKAHHLF